MRWVCVETCQSDYFFLFPIDNGVLFDLIICKYLCTYVAMRYHLNKEMLKKSNDSILDLLYISTVWIDMHYFSCHYLYFTCVEFTLIKHWLRSNIYGAMVEALELNGGRHQTVKKTAGQKKQWKILQLGLLCSYLFELKEIKLKIDSIIWHANKDTGWKHLKW